MNLILNYKLLQINLNKMSIFKQINKKTILKKVLLY